MESPLTGAEGATVPADAAAPEIRPYPGLRPFREDETHLFFGREEPSPRAAASRLVASRFVAVVGTSGSGKSSLVRAGLLPDLLLRVPAQGTGSDWVVVETSARQTIRWAASRRSSRPPAGPSSPDELRTNSAQILDTRRPRTFEPGSAPARVDRSARGAVPPGRVATTRSPISDEKASFVRLLLQCGRPAARGR